MATDVAATGLHIEGLEIVINYDLPGDIENYVHRIGRTARAGSSGRAIYFACEKFGKHLDSIESFIRMKIPEERAGIGLLATDNSVEYEQKMFGRQRARKSGAPQEKSVRRKSRSGMR